MRTFILIASLAATLVFGMLSAQAGCTTTCQNRNGQQECFTNCNSWNHA